MALGSTTKKIQVMAERAEEVYHQIMELRDQITELRGTVERTGDRVDELSVRSEKSWAIVQAIAEELDIDVDDVLTDAAIEEVGTEEGADAATDEPPANPE